MTTMQQDILAARYFKNGETTYDEVCDRVANFIGDSPAEVADYAELMKQRKFLPNSPTLMNAGCPEPFMSACVVLPIEDNMKSIFNTVRDAAVCHQKGAGCIAEGSLVFTKRGIIPIEDVVVGDEVWSVNQKSGKQSYKKVTDTHIYGVDDKKILKINFYGKQNYVITSDYHPFTVINEKGKLEFVEAKDLQHGSLVLVGSPDATSLKIGKTAFKIGKKVAETDSLIPSFNYTNSAIASFLAGLLQDDEYVTLREFEGTFEDYVESLKAKPGDIVLSFIHRTEHKYNRDMIIGFCSRLGILTESVFANGKYSIHITFNLATSGHKVLTMMYPGIEFNNEDAVKYNAIYVENVEDGECNCLRDLTVEGNNTYFASTSGVMCFIHNTGFSFNELRPQGALVNSSQGKASGPISFMKVYDTATGVVSQGGCFVEDTLILTDHGPVRIADLHEGDLLMSYIGDGKFDYRRCSKPFKTIKNSKVVEVISNKNVKFRATETHPVMNLETTYVQVKDMRIGMSVKAIAGLELDTKHTIMSITPVTETYDVWNVEVEETHNYIVCSPDGEYGIVVSNSRRGANMGILNIDHPDILNFIKCKEVEGEIQNFNISVMITDEFMNAVINKEFDKVMSTTQDGKAITVGELWKEITEHAWRNGEPGVLFYDTINADSTVPKLGKMVATNPCSELPLLPYESCTLGSINLAKFVYDRPYDMQENLTDFKKYFDEVAFSHAVRSGVRFLDSVVSKNDFPLKELKDMAEKTRKIGLGLMGVHDAMIRLNIPYDSDMACKFVYYVMNLLTEVAFETSFELAEEKGICPAFDDEFTFPAAHKALHGIRHFYPYYNMYCEEHGLRNANLTTIAPTGTISLLADCSSGIEPVFSYIYKRTNVVGKSYDKIIHPLFKKCIEDNFPDEKDREFIFEHMYSTGSIQDLTDLIPERIRAVYKTALDVSPEWHVTIQSEFQKWVMSSISKTINMPESATVEDIANVIKDAYTKGCKGLTIYRTNSRQNVVLNLGDKKKEEEAKSEDVDVKKICNETWVRENPMYGHTYTIQSGCCKLYVTINSDSNGEMREVFIRSSGHGGCEGLLGALGRDISLYLQAGAYTDEKVRREIRSLSKTACAACIRNKAAEAKSCSAAVAKCMQREYEYLQQTRRTIMVTEKLEAIDLDKIASIAEPAQDTWNCPECGTVNVDNGGCKTCRECGYSKCG